MERYRASKEEALNTEPCGTPTSRLTRHEEDSLIPTNCFLFVRYELNQLRTTSLTPQLLASLSSNTS